MKRPARDQDRSDVTLPTPTPIRAGDDHVPGGGPRVPAGFVAAVLAVALGVGGLVVGAREQAGTAAAGGPTAPADPAAAAGVSVGDLTVTNVYIREPASPDVAAAYLTVRNAGGEGDSLESAYSGAAKETTLHGLPGKVEPGAHEDSGPIPVPADTTVTLAPGRGHVMLEGLSGPLRPGDEVSVLLRFGRSGQVLVEAPVIAIGAPAPGGGSS